MGVTPRKRASPAVRSSATGMSKQVIEVPDPDFHNFDCTRTKTDIKPGQTWAIYDDKDGMPRYYGRISSVSLCPFKVQFWWLVFDQRSSKGGSLWSSSSGYYVSTGEFQNGDFTTSKIINIFSHRMYVKEKFVRGACTLLKIYPRKAEVWALYRDWDQVPLSTDTPSNVTCRFDMVEILVDYSKENGVKTVRLERVPGFRTVFRRQDGPQAVNVWTASDLMKFSHNVPAVKVQQNKLMGIPKQALELDPAAIPHEYSELDDGSGDMEMRPQPAEVVHKDTEEELKEEKHTSARPSNKRQQKPAMNIIISTPVSTLELSQRNAKSIELDTDHIISPLALSQGNDKSLELDTDHIMSALALSQDNAKSLDQDTDHSVIELEEIDLRPNLQEIFSPALVNSAFRSCSGLSAMQTQQTGSEVDFYDFNSLRMEADIEAGQIWATYDTVVDKMPRIYVRVVQVLGSPFKLVDIWRLQSHPCSEKMKSWMDRTGLAMSCGRFRNDKRDVMGLENFSHFVSDRDKKCVKIYPRKGEVWAMYRNGNLDNGVRSEASGTVHINGYDLVEILSDFLGDESLEIVSLVKVTGFRSLFQRQGKSVMTTNVQPDFLVEFSHSIPARKMYKDDTLGIPFGALEVDPACLLP